MKRPVLFTGDIFRLQPRGGISRYVIEMGRRLERKAYVAAGLYRSGPSGHAGLRFSASGPLPNVPGAMRAAAPVNALLDRAAFARDPRAILHPTYYRNPASLPARRPVVLTVHDLTHERLGVPIGRGPEGWKRALAHRADAVMCYSESTREDCIRMLDLAADRVHVAPLASRTWSETPALPLQGFDPRARFLLWVGPRHAYKNFERAARAWAACGALGDAWLVCIGGGAFNAAERALLGSLHATHRVHQADASDSELHWAYARAAGLIYPSLWEGFGLPIVEAMALGCPVLTSDRSAMPEVGGSAAFYADPENPNALVAGLERLAREGRTEARIEASRTQAAKFSWARCAAAHERVYEALD